MIQPAPRRQRPGFAEICRIADLGWAAMDRAPGLRTEREGRFLTFALAAVPVKGAVVEIGSFKGKSTVGLATVARDIGLGPVTAIDPHTSPSITDPDLQGRTSSLAEFQRTVADAGLVDHVDLRRAFSGDIGASWNSPIAFLWIDGDHTLEGVRIDFDLFGRWLVDGAIIAFHDTLNPGFAGPIRVFTERVLESDSFGAAGFCGSIGWAQFRPRDGGLDRPQRTELARAARRLFPYAIDGNSLSGWRKIVYKLARARVAHRSPDFAGWLERTVVD
jgi:predicted O-methyltransferase YrrM